MTTVASRQELTTPEPHQHPANMESFIAEAGIAAASMYLLSQDKAPIAKGLAAVATARQSIDMAFVLSDRELNDDTFVVVTDEHLRSLRLTALGLTLTAAGNKMAETKPAIGNALKVSGLALSVTGLVRSIPAIKSHWKSFQSGLLQPMSEERKQKLPPYGYNK